MKPHNLMTKQLDNLVYLDDYIDSKRKKDRERKKRASNILTFNIALEAIPVDLQRNFTLMRELDGYAQDLIETVSREAIYLIDNIKDMDPNTRIDKFKYFMTVLTETLKRGEEKVALAKSTFDIVERHCNRLDSNLVKFEEEQTLGDARITTLPGLEPSSRYLKEGTDIREKTTKRLERERKEVKGEKRIVKSKSIQSKIDYSFNNFSYRTKDCKGHERKSITFCSTYTSN
ncbi:Putative Pho23 protein [Rhizopus microsporus]|nr:Putative Pho23 protein [Rhizopus microsporus]